MNTMTIAEIITSLEDQAQDKLSLAAPDEMGDVFHQDAHVLLEAAKLLSAAEMKRRIGVMNRITYKAQSNCGFVWALHVPGISMQDAINRLAAYEDTGLEPEEIMGLCSMHERAKMAELLRMEENKPLTLEELRGMCGEPVYDDLGGQWHVIEDVNYYDELYLQIVMTDGVVFDTDANGPRYFLERLYRRKPKEGTHE